MKAQPLSQVSKNIGMRDILYTCESPEERGIILEDCYIFKGFELIKGIPDELIEILTQKPI